MGGPPHGDPCGAPTPHRAKAARGRRPPCRRLRTTLHDQRTLHKHHCYVSITPPRQDHEGTSVCAVARADTCAWARARIAARCGARARARARTLGAMLRTQNRATGQRGHVLACSRLHTARPARRGPCSRQARAQLGAVGRARARARRAAPGAMSAPPVRGAQTSTPPGRNSTVEVHFASQTHCTHSCAECSPRARASDGARPRRATCGRRPTGSGPLGTAGAAQRRELDQRARLK